MGRLPQINNQKSPGRRRGFTLLEVIVAMTVLAIGITGVLAAVSACLRHTELAENYSRGAIFAQQVAALLERNTTLGAGTQSGTFTDQSTGPDDSVDTAIGNPTSGFTWTAVVSPADSTGCYPAQITVTWGADQRQNPQQFQLNTVLLPQALPSSPPPAVPGTIAPPASGGTTPAATRGASS